jgi:hypothetical protein
MLCQTCATGDAVAWIRCDDALALLCRQCLDDARELGLVDVDDEVVSP